MNFTSFARLRAALQLLPVIATLLISACGLWGHSAPSTELVTAIVKETLLADGRDKMFEVVSVTKTNGTQDGDSAYRADVDVVLAHRHSFEETTSMLFANAPPIQAMALGQVLIAKFGQFSKGEKFKRSLTFRFNWSEKGWALDNAQTQEVLNKFF